MSKNGFKPSVKKVASFAESVFLISSLLIFIPYIFLLFETSYNNNSNHIINTSCDKGAALANTSLNRKNSEQ